MNGGPSVIVNKGGFLTALVKGIFGTIMVVLVCGTLLGLYSLYALTSPVGSAIKEIARCLPDWQKAMPAVVAEALDDRRALDYERQLSFTTRAKRFGADRDRGVVVVEIRNNGPEVVSYLTLRLHVEDEGDGYVRTLALTGASPLQLGADWPGPLLPGHTKVLARCIGEVAGKPEVTYELTDLRVARSRAEPAEAHELPLPEGSAKVSVSARAAQAGEPD